MTGTVYKGSKNNNYTLADRVGGGGEGEVYAIREDSHLVIKIYKEDLDRDKIDKLTYMVSLVNGELLRFAAWPIDIAIGQTGSVCGFIMTKLNGFVPLHMLFTPGDRKRLFPDKGYNFLVHVARNLAVAFHKVHQMNIIIGDVNEANILVSSTGMVALIDCDSFQIKNGTHYHYCEVGMLRYTPPELLQRGGFDRTIRTINTDSFSLATLIFQLLFLGRSPFTGTNPGKKEIDEETAIKSYEFAYSLIKPNKQLFPAKNSLQISALSPGLVNAFHNAFESKSTRPTPITWANELTVLNKELVSCSESKLHFYPARIAKCPWCKFKNEENIHYFLDDSYLKVMPELDNIERFINGFRLEPLKINLLSINKIPVGVEPEKIDRRFYILNRTNLIVYIGIVIVTIYLFFQSTAYFVGGIVALFLFYSISPTRAKLKTEFTNRQHAFNELKRDLQTIIEQHNSLNENRRYDESVKKLTESMEAFKRLPTEYSKNKKGIEDKHYQIEFSLFLQQFEVLYSQIVGFGPAKKRSVYSAGIRTAADVGKLKQSKIPGIGLRNEQVLYDWQRQVGAGFIYHPDNRVITAEIKQVAEIIIQRKQQLEQDINIQYRVVIGFRSAMLSSAKALEEKYNDLLPKVYQAELNVQAFEKLAR